MKNLILLSIVLGIALSASYCEEEKDIELMTLEEQKQYVNCLLTERNYLQMFNKQPSDVELAATTKKTTTTTTTTTTGNAAKTTTPAANSSTTKTTKTTTGNGATHTTTTTTSSKSNANTNVNANNNVTTQQQQEILREEQQQQAANQQQQVAQQQRTESQNNLWNNGWRSTRYTCTEDQVEVEREVEDNVYYNCVEEIGRCSEYEMNGACKRCKNGWTEYKDGTKCYLSWWVILLIVLGALLLLGLIAFLVWWFCCRRKKSRGDEFLVYSTRFEGENYNNNREQEVNAYNSGHRSYEMQRSPERVYHQHVVHH
jgi:cobalamin biosynthesis Mg chelatase CobN